MSKVLFVYDHQYPDTWRDGLWAATELLEWDRHNLQDGKPDYTGYDFVVAWGAFGSPAEIEVGKQDIPKGLCIAGNINKPYQMDRWDVLFYETEWYTQFINHHPNTFHAFGTNTDIYKKQDSPKVFDWITVGAFALWKRHNYFTDKEGVKLAIGELQKGNSRESLAIMEFLLKRGVMVSDMVHPEKLANLYNLSVGCYIPAQIVGGGERAILEARACGCQVEIERDNPKLKEVVEGPIYDHHYYASQLQKGVLSCQ